MPDGHRHLPSGVPVGLNWRPTEFRQPVPMVRICSLCGLFPRRVTLLPCSHAVCERCLEGCVGEGSECPLDREKFSAEECHQVALAADKVLKLEVHCWNSVHGCGFLGPLSQLLEHFENECRFHEVSCRQCQALVLHANIPRHLRHECGEAAVSGGASRAPEHVSSRSSGDPHDTCVSASSLTVRDVNKALTELKKMLADSTTDQLAVFETKMNELAENMASLAAKILTAVETKETTTIGLPRHSEPLVHSEVSSVGNMSRESMSRLTRAEGALLGIPGAAAPLSTQHEVRHVPMPSYGEGGPHYPSGTHSSPSPPILWRSMGAINLATIPTHAVEANSASGRGATQNVPMNTASFLIHSERKGVSRLSYDLTLGAWASFRKKASNAQSHVYATSVVWNGQDMWFSVLLTFDSFEDTQYLNAYVKFYNTAVQPGQGVSPTPPPSLAILHPSNSGMALTGRAMKSPGSRGVQRDSNITSEGYVLYLSMQVVHLEEGGYAADNNVRFRLVVSDACR